MGPSRSPATPDARPLLMIPGPVEVSPAVRDRFAEPPPGHLAPHLIEAFGASLERMRDVWCAAAADQPFVVAGGGTLAMDMAVSNLMEAGDRALVVSTGYFSQRLVEMLRRQGCEVVTVEAPVGDAPPPDAVRVALDSGGPPPKALFATHVDTSTGVRLDPRPLVALARERGMLSVFDGVCATAAEPFPMADWGADVYFTASQKAVGLPPGLALLVASQRALAARERRRGAPPPMFLDWHEWLPVMRAYESRRPAYFSTPATNLVRALEVGLAEILAEGLARRVALHERAGRAMRAAWRALGLTAVPVREELAANTLSALLYPEGVDASLVGRVLERGVVVAGGLHAAIRDRYFRVGHMGHAVTRAEMLERTVRAVGGALEAGGRRVDVAAAVDAAAAILEQEPAALGPDAGRERAR
jgi:alanine-glyoxylate transaminase/serine-glyoxylate transaminase/serine-pyruvate transaminase